MRKAPMECVQTIISAKPIDPTILVQALETTAEPKTQFFCITFVNQWLELHRTRSLSSLHIIRNSACIFGLCAVSWVQIQLWTRLLDMRCVCVCVCVCVCPVRAFPRPDSDRALVRASGRLLCRSSCSELDRAFCVF
jgi:hypothetical protein